MSSNVVNASPYLRTTRSFPEELQPLTVEVNKSYLDIAAAVNDRTIGIFSSNRPSITGNAWFVVSNQKQQTLRQVYPFSAAGSIAHGITVSGIAGFVQIYGTVSDDSGNWYPLPYVDTVDVTNQISLQVTSTNIVITQGAGALFIIQSGFVVLEWLSAP